MARGRRSSRISVTSRGACSSSEIRILQRPAEKPQTVTSDLCAGSVNAGVSLFACCLATRPMPKRGNYLSTTASGTKSPSRQIGSLFDQASVVQHPEGCRKRLLSRGSISLAKDAGHVSSHLHEHHLPLHPGARFDGTLCVARQSYRLGQV